MIYGKPTHGKVKTGNLGNSGIHYLENTLRQKGNELIKAFFITFFWRVDYNHSEVIESLDEGIQVQINIFEKFYRQKIL